MADYPDWTRLFYLTGTAITIPINIESSDITLDVNLVGSDIQMDVNVVAAAVTLDFNFADQSVAVFDAAKWFAHQAQQWSVTGFASVTNNTLGLIVSRTVPAGKVAFIVGLGYYVDATTVGPLSMACVIDIASVRALRGGAYRGDVVILDTPLRATAGQLIEFYVGQFGSGASLTCEGAFWGYDEAV